MSLEHTHIESPSYTLITDANILQTFVSQWLKAEAIAIDTEFIRTHTFFAEPGLIQIADGHGVYLIDTLAIEDLSVLISVLESTNVIKIMHSMSEDVGLLFHSVGAQINQVFDTQIVAAFLGIAVSPGYQNLVLDVLNIELDKGETRSDWLQRPLTQSQLHYAALDVIYLLKLYQVLKPKLEAAGFLEALFEETDFLIEQVVNAWHQPELAYLKLRGGWELPKESQQLLQALVVWRDQMALQENLPKPWVFNDASLIEIARIQPKNVIELKRVKGLQSKSYRQFSERLIAFINSFEFNKDSQLQLIDAPVKGEELKVHRKLKAVIANVSKQTGIPAQLLGSRKMIESLVIHCFRNGNKYFTEEFKGWRLPLLGQQFSKVLFEEQ
jgi:ribonuclease D